MLSNLWNAWRPIITDNLLQWLTGAIISYGLIKLSGALNNYRNNRWLSNLEHYQGEYFAYRWRGPDRDDLVIAKAKIFRKYVFSKYMFSWQMPNGKPTNYQMKETYGREIYATGTNKSTNFIVTFVLHPAHTDPVEVISGVYLFLDMGHRIACGNFLLSRSELSRDEVERLLPPSFTASSQREASTRYNMYKELQNKKRILS